MAESQRIARKKSQNDPYSFESLRREGVELVQELSGNIWTDYNLHDPGVTILEQLCYALTDVMFRTDFKVEDHLTNKDGSIDFEGLALHPPEEAFPCRAMTITDYRKAVLDSVPEIDNVWLRKAEKSGYGGLYRITARLGKDRAGINLTEMVEKVRRVYKRNRNLCEDIAEVTILEEIDCELSGHIEITGEREPAEIAADIYYECSRQFITGIRFSPYDEVLAEGKSLEEILRGPLLGHGFVKEDELDSNTDDLLIPAEKRENVEETLDVFTANLFSVIKGIGGVKYIKNLFLQKKQVPETPRSLSKVPDATLHLSIPHDEDEIKITLLKNGRKVPVSIQRLRARYDKLSFKSDSLRHILHDISSQVSLPQGEFRDLQQYYSIQNQFPFIYGINAYGVPDSEPLDVKARAIQLKTFLLLFEQILANYTANLHHVRLLFSTDDQLKQSYFFQQLDNNTIPGIDAVYDGKAPSQILGEIVSEKYDVYKYPDRRSRLLDYLLALHGEKFSQTSLRYFHDYYTPDEVEQAMIDNKLNFLKNIVKISRHRAGGFNDDFPSWNTANVSMLKKKVCLLLGLKYFETRSLTDVFIESGLELVTDEQFGRVREGYVELEFVDIDDIDDRTNQTFQRLSPEQSALGKEDIQLFQEVLFLKNNVISESILRGGIDLDRYRVGSTGRQDEAYQVVFKPQEQGRWHYLASYRTKEEAVGSASDVRKLLIRLNRESEGLHIIEHILLRPVSEEVQDKKSVDDFYSFRISLIFPSWSVRFNKKEFRELAEETARLNCPAHIHPEFYWLDFAAMCEFELLYKTWLEKRCDQTQDVQELDAVADRLAVFLRKNKRGVKV